MIAGRLQMKMTKISDEKVMYNEPCRMHSKKTTFDVTLLRKLLTERKNINSGIGTLLCLSSLDFS
jgi:hypothetical protein